jgi:DNA-binding transcriptional ArsR family regulator
MGVSGELLRRVRAEIDARLRELRPAVAEYERLLATAESLRSNEDHAPAATARRRRAVVAPKRERAPRGAAQLAIVAALEHGSHTVSELVVVTAMSGANVRANLRRLVSAGTVTTAKRDGKAAYALASPVA